MTRIALLAFLLPVASMAAMPNMTSPAVFYATSTKLDSGRVDLLKFQPLEEADVAMECESAEPPQALATPHAWVTAIPDGTRIVVNFIVGTDGQVYSPFVLDGRGSDSLFRKLVNEVRRWHYRPALCNGVPTDAEVKVQLSNR
ncbi:MAG TPA: energy transducer TonB [Terriglobales bacterium]|jgi:hypothetical protein|nr:energy transducer TonB [Terriglobales bacterium]